MADDADGSSEPLSGVALLNAALDGLLDILVGLKCLTGDADYIWQYGEQWDVLFDLDGDYYGLAWRPNNISDATRRPRGVWVSDWQIEVINWLMSEGVDVRGLSSDELVAAASKKLGGWDFLLRPETDADYVAKAAGVGEVLKYVPQHVKGLWDGQAKADKAIQAFPAVVLTALDGLRGGSWRTRLRSELLNVVCRWPGTKGQGMSARYVSDLAKVFVSQVGDHDPRETWKKYIDLVEDARADILAAAGELPIESTAATQPPDSPHAAALRKLAAEVAAERKRAAAIAESGDDRFRHYFGPYGGVWIDLEHSPCNPQNDEPLDPEWLLERLTALIDRAKKLDDYDGGSATIDWLKWLPDSPAAKKDRVAMALAMAIAAAVDGALTYELAAAFCGMLEINPGSAARALYHSRQPSTVETDEVAEIASEPPPAPATPTVIDSGSTPALDGLIHNYIAAPSILERCLERDAQAIAILSTEPALPQVIARLDRIYWGRQARERTGRPPIFPRIWTHRDERFLNIQRGFIDKFTWTPERRADRFYRRLAPRSGLRLHDAWFQQALDEARRNGTATALTPKLDAAREAFQKLLEIALRVIEGDATIRDYSAAHLELMQPTCDLMPWASPREKPKAIPTAEPDSVETPKLQPTGPTTVEEFERTTPPLDKSNGHWLRATDDLMKGEASVNSLKTMRNSKKDGATKTADGLFGIDKTGRRWRKESKVSTVIWYWRGTLKGKLRLSDAA
jgi:hypothetical protein